MLKPGEGSTEYKIAKAFGIAGLSLQPIAGFFATIAPDNKWVAITMAIAGCLAAIAGALGYQIPRANLKSDQIKAEAAVKVSENESQNQNSSLPSTS